MSDGSSHYGRGKMRRRLRFDLAWQAPALQGGQMATVTCEWGCEMLLWLRIHTEK
jgi:hypothetical protein